MEKNKKIPTAKACDFFSWTTALSGICAGIVYFFTRPISVSSAMLSLLLVLGLLVMAVVIRILGIIGQILFELSGRLESLEGCLNKNILDLKEGASAQRGMVEQINCDTKDLNENIRQIETFFEMIERHLNLKK